MFQQVVTNYLETNEKKRNISEEIEIIKKNQMEITERKNVIIKIKAG